MITWLQNNLEKHFRSVFIILLVVIIVAFVFTIGAMPSGGPSGKKNDLKFYEIDLSTQASRQQFFSGAQLSAYIQLNGMRMPENSMEQYAFNRATALHLANTHSIPTPNKEELSEFVQTLQIFQTPTGEFSPQQYASFVDQMELAAGFSKANLSEVLSDEWRIQKIYDVLSGPSFVQKDEILDVLKANKTEWTVAVAELDLGSYNPQIDVTDAKLQEYYDANSFRYATPDRRIISYASFNAIEFRDQVEATDEQLVEYFTLNQDNYTKPALDATAEEKTIPQTFEEAKAQVKFDYQLAQGKRAAQETAQNIILSILEKEVPFDSDEFKAILSEAKAELKTTAPFAADETPIGTSWSQDTLATAFELSESRYFSDPILEGDTAIVLFFKSEIPSTVPGLEAIKEDVALDYRAEELRRLQVARGEELQKILSDAGASLETFEAAAKEAGLTTKTYEKFTRSAPAEELSPSIAYGISNLSQGDVTPMSIQGNAGQLAYVVEKETPVIEESGAEFETSSETLKVTYERYVVSQYISELASNELVRSGIADNNG